MHDGDGKSFNHQAARRRNGIPVLPGVETLLSIGYAIIDLGKAETVEVGEGVEAGAAAAAASESAARLSRSL